MYESWYICSSSRSMETSWRKAGMQQTGTDKEKILHRPPSPLCSSLLLHLFVQSRKDKKNAKGVLRRGEARGCDVGGRKVSPEVHFNCSEAKKWSKKKKELQNNSGLLLCQEVLVKWQKLVFSFQLSLPHLICCCFSSSSPPTLLSSPSLILSD